MCEYIANIRIKSVLRLYNALNLEGLNCDL